MSVPAIVARLLTAEDDWGVILQGTELADSGLTPENARVIIVEQGSQIMGCWAAITQAHVEGLWVAPDAGAGVSRALLSKMVETLQGLGVSEVLTQSLTPAVDQLITSAGGRKLPGSTWVIPVKDL
jgi:hypothetical protein